LVPRSIVRVIRGEAIAVYGDGQHVREWIHVDDHVAAVLCALDHGQPGERYCVGTGERLKTIEVVQLILDEFKGAESGAEGLARHHADRVGNDRRYALDSIRLRSLRWAPERTFSRGLRETIEWYRINDSWWKHFFRE